MSKFYYASLFSFLTAIAALAILRPFSSETLKNVMIILIIIGSAIIIQVFARAKK